MPGIQEAMDQEIRKFEKFEAFKRGLRFKVLFDQDMNQYIN